MASLLFPFILTYRMADNIFTAWWRFARWWALAIAVITFLFEVNPPSGGGALGMDKDFTMLIFIILYGIMIVGSLVKIYRVWSKRERKDETARAG